MRRSHNSKSESQHKQVAKAIAAGTPIRTAMIEAGYSPKTAAKGKAAINGNILEAMTPSSRRLIRRARKLSWKDREDLIIGRLDENVEKGKDQAVMSCKIMGSHKSLNLWQNEISTGIVILNTPQVPETIKTLPQDEE